MNGIVNNSVLEYLVVVGVAVLCTAVLFLLLRVFRKPRKLKGPLILGLIGLAVVLAPVAYTRLVETIDLGVRERIVNDELRLTLTGWDGKSYAFLKEKPETVYLYLANTNVDDQTLDYIKDMKKLKHLDLGGSQVSDKGLEKLHGMTSIEILVLRQTKVTDEGITKLLDRLTNLKYLDVNMTDVSNEIIEKWKSESSDRRSRQD